MPLTAAQKSSVRRHLDYPVIGLLRVSPAGGTLGSAFSGYRFFQAYGRLEYRLNNLSADEEARLVGLAYGAVALIGPSPSAGDTVSVTLSGGNIPAPQVVSAVCPGTAAGVDGAVAFAQALAANAAQNTVLQAAGVVAVTPFGTGPFTENAVPVPEVAFTSPVSFSVGSPTGSGVIFPQITASGELLPPSTSVDGVNTIYGYLNILDALEGAWASASQNLDTMAAGPWKARSNEIGQRLALYKNWQVRLAEFLGVPLWDGSGTGQPKANYTGAIRYA